MKRFLSLVLSLAMILPILLAATPALAEENPYAEHLTFKVFTIRICRSSSCIGHILLSRNSRLLQNHSFQRSTMKYSVTVANAGFISGRSICQKMRKGLAPSSIAASSKSGGRDSKKLRRIIMLNALNASGDRDDAAHHVRVSRDSKKLRRIIMLNALNASAMTTAKRLPYSPKSLISRKKGTTPPPKYMVKTIMFWNSARPG